ncbi:MAG: hypothetical protein OEV46_10335 [Betaproteobacteria bacterium]|jgi:hypothetical protein|nr:hypothetical protein [Betaproteobacteria bacterium]
MLMTPCKVAAALVALLLASSAVAQDGGDDDLAAKAADPTASLMSFQLTDNYTANFHGIDDTANQLQFRAVLPWQGMGYKHILRITQPFVTSGPGRTGITDTTIFDLTTFDESWGRWGAGLVVLLPTGRDGLSAEKWAVGPSLGFVNSKSFPGWNAGLFLQSYFSFAGDDDAPRVGVLNLQPILSHQLGGGRSVSLGSSQLVYDTANSRWASVQFGLNYGQIVTAFGHKWRPNVEAGYEFRDLAGNPKWTIRAGLTLLLPTN